MTQPRHGALLVFGEAAVIAEIDLDQSARAFSNALMKLSRYFGQRAPARCFVSESSSRIHARRVIQCGRGIGGLHAARNEVGSEQAKITPLRRSTCGESIFRAAQQNKPRDIRLRG
jgi:hypothetical protein